METELILSKGGLPPFSARGCQQQLIAINNGEFKRTINGNMVFLGSGQPTKYKSVITCKDKTSAALDGVQRGSEITIGCIQRLWQKIPINQEFVKTEKPYVDNSIVIMDNQQNSIPFSIKPDKSIHVGALEKEVYLSYRPELFMQITDFQFYTDEWGIQVGWQLDCEEI